MDCAVMPRASAPTYVYVSTPALGTTSRPPDDDDDDDANANDAAAPPHILALSGVGPIGVPV